MQELAIRSESIQRIYNFFSEKILLVNRRYQRKLVWPIEDKVAFIDSIIQDSRMSRNIAFFHEYSRSKLKIYRYIWER